MSYAYHDITQLDGREANIFIVISSVGMCLFINHVVKTRRCSFMIQAMRGGGGGGGGGC
jgi:hypothetical protein